MIGELDGVDSGAESDVSTDAVDKGQEAPSFRDSLPEELRDDPSLADISSLEDMAKGYVHAQRLVGRDKLPIPVDPDDEDGWSEVYKRLGRPDAPDQYDIKLDSEDMQFDKEMVGAFTETAHKLGLSKKQAAGIAEFYRDMAKTQFDNRTQKAAVTQEEGRKILEREYGAAFDAKLSLANRVLGQMGGPAAVEKLKAAGLTNDPDIVRMLVAMGDATNEDTLGGDPGDASVLTPKAALAKIKELKLDPNFMAAYSDRYSQGHKEAVDMMSELYKFAYPNG